MNSAKTEFIELCIASNVLRFGEFRLKSGRLSPYFFDTGLFSHGKMLSQLAQHYTQLLAEKLLIAGAQRDFMLYGPAYKGIALAAATALKLADQHDLDIGYAFHRKEAKLHGEGGYLVGAKLHGNVVIIDDVITAGASIEQSIVAIKSAGAKPHSVVLALDRQEIADNHSLSATQYIEKKHHISVYALIALQDLINYLEQTKATRKHVAAILAYRNQYGIS